MPEYLAPGVYVEETSFRSQTIEGVSTTTTGFAGVTRFGPTQEVRLVTSFTEYQSVYGGLDDLVFAGKSRTNYMAHAARLFFENGGQLLYVSRVFAPVAAGDTGTASSADLGKAGPVNVFWRARFPGAYGNVSVSTSPVRRGNVLRPDKTSGVVLTGTVGMIVEVTKATVGPDGKTVPASRPASTAPLAATTGVIQKAAAGLQIVGADGNAIPVAAGDVALEIDLTVAVTLDDGTAGSTTTELTTQGDDPLFVGRVFDPVNPQDENSIVWLDLTASTLSDPETPADMLKLVHALVDTASIPLTNGDDGGLPSAVGDFGFEGRQADPDDPTKPALGLHALGEIDEIAIVAMPDAADLGDDLERTAATEALIAHVETYYRYRIAVLDGPPNASLNQIRDFRGRFDSTHAALYHPWLELLDPLEAPSQGVPPRLLKVPPSGAICGIYGRSDINRGVHKAPANEVVQGINDFLTNITTQRQEVLNPEGINALRFFLDRGYRVWGARTISSDPEWKYVNVRRLFNFIEHSLDKGTQYAVFEPNNEQLWSSIRQSVEDFLLVQWKAGALMGTKPEEAYFVRCDRTTMTQNDLDNGRMVCLVGIAPVMPAEFVIFRIGQFTASAN